MDTILDPGFGFGKSVEHNYTLLRELGYFGNLRLPVLAGLSRKSPICKALKVNPEHALNGTTAANMIALMNGANLLRVHDVKEARETVQIFKACYPDAADRRFLISSGRCTRKIARCRYLANANRTEVKRTAFVIIIICIAAMQSHGQGFTVQWMGGYGWQPGSTQPIPAQLFNSQMPYVDQWSNLANTNVTTNTNQTIKNSYGHGFNLSFLFGYMFNPYIGVTLGVSYQQSKTISANQVNNLFLVDNDSFPSTPEPTGGYITSTITTKSQNLTLSPAIVATYNKPKFIFYPYLRVGLTLPVYTAIQQQVNMTLDGVGAFNAPPDFLGAITNTELETYTNFAVGFNGALGVGYKPYPFLHLFLEVNAQYLNMKGDFSQMTEWSADGYSFNYNGVGGRGTYRSVFEYVKTLNSNSNNAAYNPAYNPNNPKQEISPNFPFSYIGFNFGVQLTLNKKIFKDMDKFEEERAIRVLKRAKKKKAAEPAPDNTTPNTPAATPH